LQMPNLQPPCFQIIANCRGGVPPSKNSRSLGCPRDDAAQGGGGGRGRGTRRGGCALAGTRSSQLQRPRECTSDTAPAHSMTVSLERSAVSG
jgi:hypothetical protein